MEGLAQDKITNCILPNLTGPMLNIKPKDKLVKKQSSGRENPFRVSFLLCVILHKMLICSARMCFLSVFVLQVFCSPPVYKFI